MNNEKIDEAITKRELLAQVVAAFPSLEEKKVLTIVDAIFDAIIESLAQGRRVEIRGLGSFGIKQRKNRVGRNPKTGTTVSVPNKRVPFFTVGKELRERVNKLDAIVKT